MPDISLEPLEASYPFLVPLPSSLNSVLVTAFAFEGVLAKKAASNFDCSCLVHSGGHLLLSSEKTTFPSESWLHTKGPREAKGQRAKGNSISRYSELYRHPGKTESRSTSRSTQNVMRENWSD